MQRVARWVVAVCAGAGSFVVCLWAARAARLGFLPRAEADRWVVATAFATTVAALVGAAAGWWAQAGTEGAGAVRQDVTASDDARVTQVAGDRRPGPGAPAQRPGVRDQRARAAGRARITQVGGDDGTTGPGRGEQ
ncbi:hypothetical protein AB0M11_13155 [Streptomyces sp. NPDC051987]|uniref:hypothetical protein n=1 Tax=Streptomyces sp. NPDC051987 TaxID=3155808 RepID=UPI0034219855